MHIVSVFVPSTANLHGHRVRDGLSAKSSPVEILGSNPNKACSCTAVSAWPVTATIHVLTARRRPRLPETGMIPERCLTIVQEIASSQHAL